MILLTQLEHPFQIAGQFSRRIAGNQAEQGRRVGVFQPVLEWSVAAHAIDGNQSSFPKMMDRTHVLSWFWLPTYDFAHAL
jgi:hypothetical protein